MKKRHLIGAHYLIQQGKRCVSYAGTLQGPHLHHQQITGWSRAL